MEYSYNKFYDKMQKYNFNLKKMYGQNFIIDENIINNIINKAFIDKDTLVIEIGPGAGSLTNKLALNAKNVLCYEIDTSLKPILDENLKEYNNVEIIYNDFLKSNVINDIKKLLDVSRNVFMPKPNVDSIVIELDAKEKKYELKNPTLFFKLIRDSFSQKRKTLRNNLKGYDLDKISEILKKYDMDLSVRAEQLSVDIFVLIANNL